MHAGYPRRRVEMTESSRSSEKVDGKEQSWREELES